ncbi:MAG: hypothetical protein MK291_06850 [Planctomycetes bacterium]|nr:hypothetical protein [Planctomycetota bacterium]
MGLERPEGHEVQLEGLWAAAKADRLPHALLFTGADGIGKHMAAKWFLAGLFCERGPAEPCGECGACRRLAAESFGDLFVIDPEADGVDRIQVGRIARREQEDGGCLEEFLSLRPAEGGWRGVILRDVERATRSAENALLKTLEEPGEACCIILVSAHPSRLLDTVRSRCVQVGFESPTRETCAGVLMDAGFDAATSKQVSRWVSSAPGRALRWARRSASSERALLVEVLHGAVDALDASPRVLALEGDLGEGTPAALARRRAAGFVDLAVEVMRDLARSGAGLPAADLPHGDLPEALLSRPGLSGAARRGSETLWRARRELDSNLAPEAVLDRALSQLQEVFTGAAAPS